MSGRSQQTAYLLPQPPDLDPAAMAKGLVESGFSCSSVREFHQLQLDDKPMDVFKIDCAEGSYQATIINGSTRLKPWTGVMLGE